MVGKIQFLNKEKAYGFIQCDEFPKGVFFHIKNFAGAFDELEKGDEVSFETIETEKGMAAEDVQLV